MKSIVFLSALAVLLPSGAAVASEELFQNKNCVACHRVDRNSMGPSFISVAAKYEGQAGYEVTLAKKIREGGSGSFGSTPMPPMPQVSEEESLTLARWILQLK